MLDGVRLPQSFWTWRVKSNLAMMKIGALLYRMGRLLMRAAQQQNQGLVLAFAVLMSSFSSEVVAQPAMGLPFKHPGL